MNTSSFSDSLFTAGIDGGLSTGTSCFVGAFFLESAGFSFSASAAARASAAFFSASAASSIARLSSSICL